VTIFANGLYVLFGSFIQQNSLLALAILLEFAESGEIFFAMPAQTIFLNAQVVQLALVDKEDFGFDEVLADFRVFLGKLIGEFETADGIDAEFERGDAEQSPFGIG
jgi:hypothetical protein